jgi:hypothetical protein
MGAQGAEEAPAAAAAAAAKPDAVPVPPRTQMPGKGCGLYALGMLLDFWHARHPTLPTALVCDKDRVRRRLDPAVYSCEPTVETRLLDVGAERGWCTPQGTVYVLEHLLSLARSLDGGSDGDGDGGYDGQMLPPLEELTEADLCAALERGHPVLVAFDVNVWTVEPVEAGGRQGHIAILCGFHHRAHAEEAGGGGGGGGGGDQEVVFSAVHSQVRCAPPVRPPGLSFVGGGLQGTDGCSCCRAPCRARSPGGR